MIAEEEKTDAVVQRDNIFENSNASDSSTKGLKNIHFECSKCRRTVMNCNEDQATKKMCKGCLAAMEFSASAVEGVCTVWCRAILVLLRIIVGISLLVVLQQSLSVETMTVTLTMDHTC